MSNSPEVIGPTSEPADQQEDKWLSVTIAATDLTF
jgi:hypothetical protein